MFRLGGRANVSPRVLVIEELVTPGIIERRLVRTHSRVDRRDSSTHDLSRCNAMLVFPVNSGVECIGAVSILPIGTKIASDDGEFALPLVLDPLHRGVHGRKR